jgi:hypothetical protein
MKMALNGDLAGMGGRKDATQERSTRKKKMTAAEWGKLLLPPVFPFIPLWEITGPS